VALNTDDGYAGMAGAWADGPALAYGPLARHLLAKAPESIRGARALDAGAGSGVAGDALRANGARVVAADREPDMAAHNAAAGPAVAADVTALPFRPGTFDVVIAAFVVNHLPDPVAGLAEFRRVARPGGLLLASTFSEDRAAAKEAVDVVAAGYGFVAPDWYAVLQECAQAVRDVAGVEAALTDAGFADWTVTEERVDVGLDPEGVVRYRLGMPHLHRFAASLSGDLRTAFFTDAVDAVRRTGERFAPLVIEAVARVGGEAGRVASGV
jgi:ubiquinone/menaquinone biosynthesis C-methylase UbiE